MREDLPVVYVHWGGSKLGRYFVSGACSLCIILIYCFIMNQKKNVNKKGKLC